VKCLQCNNITYSVESFLDLSLDLSDKALSIEEAIANFTKIETLDVDVGYKCDKCNKAVKAQKQLTIRQAPNVLSIQLKRFDLKFGGLKINKTVIFRETLELNRVMSKGLEQEDNTYDLYALIVHYGTTVYSGHYTSFVKIDGVWWLFDDKEIHIVDASIVLRQNAYLLYYKKRIPHVAKATHTSTSISSTPSGGRGRGKNRNRKRNQKVETSQPSKESTIDIKPSTEHSEESNFESENDSQNTPLYKVYYREGASTLQDIVVTVSLPQLDESRIAGLQVKVTEDGKFLLSDKLLYYLSIVFPFGVNCQESTSTFYKDRMLVVILPILPNTPKDPKPALSLQSQIKQEQSSVVDVDPDSEVEVAHIEKKKKERKFTIEEGLAVVEKLNLEREEAQYKTLYDEIYAAYKSKKHEELLQRQSKTTPGVQKVGRNDFCPCGSGKKYKKCHGTEH